mmetsp:Transcript_13427/g.23860  ORF Transcript_13427/g.23860 Transcript_13427/m.23860 type:complete len:166 (+) Transcript_13427:39-536(+)
MDRTGALQEGLNEWIGVFDDEIEENMRVDLPTFCFHPDSSTLTREEIQLLPTADETVHRDPKSDHSSPPLVNEQDFSNDIESYDCVKNDFSTEEMFKPRPSGKLRLVEEKSGEDKVMAVILSLSPPARKDWQGNNSGECATWILQAASLLMMKTKSQHRVVNHQA